MLQFRRFLPVLALLALAVPLVVPSDAEAVSIQNRNRSGQRQALEQLVMPIGLSASASEVDTGFDIPSTGVIVDAYIYVTTAEATGATKTLDLGLLSSESGGDANGFAVGVDVSATGVKRLSLLSSGQTKGALLSEDESGAGVLVPRPFDCASVTAKSVSRTLGSNDWVEFVGYLVILYSPLPTAPLP